ncbi:MAG: ABC transporter permease, partial [Solirubrobacteraceae bacterium]
MIAVALGGLRMRKLRAALTALAILLGVAMISGTYVVMDTTTHAFDSLFTTAYSKADAVVTGKSPVSGVAAPSLPATLVGRIAKLPQVSAVQGFITDARAQLRSASGGAISGMTLALGAPGASSTFSTLQVVSGHRATGPGEIAVDEQTAQHDHLKLGSRIGLVSMQPLEWFRVVGIIRYGGVGSLGPIRLVALDLPVAQRLFDKQGVYDEIYVASRGGVSGGQLVRAIAPLLPATAKVQTRAQEVQSQTNDVNSLLSIIRDVLLTFAGIALFVGSFVIFNTLSVTVAQRTREFATLRTLGASRRQVLGSVVLEALVIGLGASLLGLVAGLGLAKGLEALFASTGTKLPSAGTVFATRTVIVSLSVGIAVTLVASLAPALRATRVPPIAAVREGAVLTPMRFAALWRSLFGVIAIAGAAVLGIALFAHGLPTSSRLLLLAGGAAVLFVGLAYVSRWLVGPLAAAVGGPFTHAGVPGMLARENSTRNPGRTASTAGALTVGVAIVVFVAVLGAGLRATVNNGVRQQLRADYVMSASNNMVLSPAAGEALIKGGISATAVRQGQISVGGKTAVVTGVDPAQIARFYNFTWAPGSSAKALTQLGRSGALVSSQFATDHHLSLGSRFTATTDSGAKLLLTVRGIQQLPVVVNLAGQATISTALFDRSFSQPGDAGVLIDTGGPSAGAKRTLTRLLAGFPNAKIQTVSQFIATTQASITALLNLFYVLLALSIVVSLFGIVNTLVLSILERTREIGTLRAMGMTRRQVRRMIRIESEITAL